MFAQAPETHFRSFWSGGSKKIWPESKILVLQYIIRSSADIRLSDIRHHQTANWLLLAAGCPVRHSHSYNCTSCNPGFLAGNILSVRRMIDGAIAFRLVSYDDEEASKRKISTAATLLSYSVKLIFLDYEELFFLFIHSSLL